MRMIDRGYVYANVDKLEQLLLKKKMSFAELKEQAEAKRVARQTVEGVFDPERRSQIRKLQIVLDLLDAPDDFDTYVLELDEVADRTIAQWDIDEKVSSWTTAANGLAYRIYKLRHVQLPNRFARGKYYDLDDVGDMDFQAMESLLLRHPQVCDRLSINSRFPVSLQLEYTADKKHFWVIDNWPEGKPVAECFEPNGRMPLVQVSEVMLHLAEALTTLHGHNIVLRDLHPDRVYVREDGDVHITDFELAKLLDGSPTVRRGEILPNSYRAPEVDGPNVDQSADYYSWAQLFYFAATGQHPPMPARADSVDALQLPKSLDRFVRDCLNLDSDLRPKTFAKITKQLSKCAKSR